MNRLCKEQFSRCTRAEMLKFVALQATFTTERNIRNRAITCLQVFNAQSWAKKVSLAVYEAFFTTTENSRPHIHTFASARMHFWKVENNLRPLMMRFSMRKASQKITSRSKVLEYLTSDQRANRKQVQVQWSSDVSFKAWRLLFVLVRLEFARMGSISSE